MIQHSQYFTTGIYSSALVSAIDMIDVRNILDMGIGDGALSYASLSRWPEAIITAFDIDKDICNQYAENNNNIEVINADVLSNNFIEHYNVNEFDLAICNPPFIKIKKENRFDSLFERANLTECKRIKQLTADLIFLTINLILLKNGGCCAIILPDGPLTRVDYKPFRDAIINNYMISKIVELPEKSFRRTEARTHILVIHKQKPIDNYSQLSIMDNGGKILDTIYVPQKELVERLDYTYNKWKYNNSINTNDKDLSISIKRGSFPYKVLRESSHFYIHSNSYSDGDILKFEKADFSQFNNKVIAIAGDIVMCRVGKRCVGKIAYIERGMVLISDCLYKITVPKKYSRKLFNILCDENSKEWVKISSHGVCSKVISKTDLIEYIKMRI